MLKFCHLTKFQYESAYIHVCSDTFANFDILLQFSSKILVNSGTTAFPIHVSLVPVQMVLEPTDVTAPQAEWVRIVKQTLTNAPASHVNMAEDVSIN